MRWTCTAGLLLLLCHPAAAHPVPKDNHDRTIVVRLTSGGVVLDYLLEVDESRAAEDLQAADLGVLTTRKDFHAAYTHYMAGVLAGNFKVTLDGRELPVECVRHRHQLLDHVRCDFRFRAPWVLQAGKAQRFAFHEGNFTEGPSKLHLSLDATAELTLRDAAAPDEALLALSPDLWKPGDADRLRRASATVLAVPRVTRGVARASLPPDPEPGRDGASRRLRRMAARGKPAPPYAVGFAKPLPPPEEGAADEGPATGGNHLIHLLFDTERGVIALLLLAAAFGAVHALTPGHGKTMVAAYLVGQRGTVWHAWVLGLSTTLAHTGGVIVVALGLALWFRGARPADLQAALGLVGGLLIAGLGLWLLMTRLLGRADHFHLPGVGHHHDEPQPAPPAAGWWQVVVLGVAGGIIPCWDAVALLLAAVAAHRLWLGVPLLLAFSAGLAAVLVVLGIVVVQAGDAVHTRLGGRARFEKIVRVLPTLSAAVITALGLFLAFTSARAAP
jgi:ABC-type nickel/cobalt efflux system permease component RcnA